MKVNATNPCATGTCPPKNLLPQGYVDMMRGAMGMGTPFGSIPNPMAAAMPQRAMPRAMPQQERAPQNGIDPRQLCHDDYAAIAMLPVFGGAVARFAGTIPDPVTMLGTGCVAVAQFWQSHNYPACNDGSPLGRGCHVGILLARCFVEGEVLDALVRDLAAKGLPVRGGGAPSSPTPSSSGAPPTNMPSGNPGGPRLPNQAPIFGPAFGYPVGPYYGGVPDMAPQAPMGVPTYGPGPFPTLAASYGQGCFSPYDCPPGQYCHQGVCMPSPWAGGHMGVTQEPGRDPSAGLRPRRKNYSDLGGTALNLAASGFGQLLFPQAQPQPQRPPGPPEDNPG